MTASFENRLLELELDPEPASVTHARHACRDLARDVGAPEADVALAVSEAVGNSVVHAYRNREPGKIRIGALLHGDMLLIEVADDGRGMTPDVESRGLGMGITLISRCAREARFTTSEAGTKVAMSFVLAEAA